MLESKRIATFLLATLMVLSLFAGCTEGAGPEGIEPTAGADGSGTDGSGADGSGAATGAGEALVDRVTVLSATANTLEIEVAGNLPDGCTTLAGATLKVDSETIFVNITTRRPVDQMCTEALVPFVETYAFDVGDVRPGDYTVDANGATAPVTIADSGEDDAFTSGTALVDAVQIAVLESFPVQIQAQVQGSLRDGCTTIAGTTQRQEGTTIYLDVLTRRPADEMCTQALVPFSESFAVDVHGLAAGTYVLDVNGATAEFTLDVDNEAGADPFAQCAFADPSQPSYANTTDGYCIQHPLGFVAEAPVPGVLIISDTGGESPLAVLTVERQGPADGRNARAVAEAQLAQFVDSGAALTESTIDIGGEPALVFDGVPGATTVRQAFVIHDGMVYVLTLAPVDAAYPAAGDRAEALWLAAVTTLTWLSG